MVRFSNAILLADVSITLVLQATGFHSIDIRYNGFINLIFKL